LDGNMKKRENISSKKAYVKRIDIVILSTVFLMLIFLLIGLWAGSNSYKSKRLAMIQDTMDVLADNQRVQFENYINKNIEILQGLVTFPEIYKMDIKKQYDFIKGRSQKLGFHHIFVMNTEGIGFYVETGEHKDQKAEPFFQNIMENDIYVTEPFYGDESPIMTICVSIYDKSDNKVGVLCGAIELEQIAVLFSENRMIQSGKSFLVNREGHYMTAEDMQKVQEQVSVYEETNSDFDLIQKAFDEKKDQSGRIIQNGAEYQANVSYLENYDWVIVQCIETDEIFKDIRYIDFWKYISLAIVVIISLCVTRIVIYWHKSERRSETDVLTGCRSRASMEKLLEWLEKEKQYDVTIIYMDLNKFKQINDTYGHDKGDDILCIFSAVLMEVFGEYGYVGRIGGDEFIVVLLNTPEQYVAQMCELVEERLKEKSKELEFAQIISTSFGFATRTKGSRESLDDIISKADEKMYQNKQERRS